MDKLGVGFASVTESEKKYVLAALDQGRLSSGQFVCEFEKKFANKHHCQYGVMCTSGTSALHLSLETLKEVCQWDETTEVLVPSISFIATSNACLHAGLKPVFVDVDIHSYNMNPAEIEKHITAKTKALIMVHVFGLPCEVEPILEIAQKYHLKVIEDCADAHFAVYKGKTVGSFGDLAAFSTYVAHTITTGIGGITTTNQIAYVEVLRSLLAHGRACTCEICLASQPRNVCKKRMETEQDKRFTFERLGYSNRVGELEGALGLAQLERCEEIMMKRHENAALLTQLLKPFEDDLQLPAYPSYMTHTFMMYPILICSPQIPRKELVAFLEEKNIETRPMFPVLNQPIYLKLFGNLEKDYPAAQYINQHGFYIGCHHGLQKEDIAYIAEVFADFFTKNKQK